MKDLTLSERSLICALLHHYMLGLGTSMKHPEVTEAGKARYAADLVEAEQLIEKLTAWRVAA